MRYLNAQNSELVEKVSQHAVIQDEIKRLSSENDVLLTLLGEKEEELESAFADMKEIRSMYKDQIDDLIRRIPAK